MTGRCLVTTALEETWPDNHTEVLFLGEWCRLHSRKKHWETMNSKVMNYHWDDREKLYSDYKYVLELYEKILTDLSDQLNSIHNVNHQLRYWRILVGQWLLHFIQVLFDRWTCINQAENESGPLFTYLFIDDTEAQVPNDVNDFNRLFHDDSWNYHIYAEIIQNHTNISCLNREMNERGSNKLFCSRPISKHSLRNSIKRFVLLAVHKFSFYLGRSTDVLLAATYMSRANEVKLQWRLGQIPKFYTAASTIPGKANHLSRIWSLRSQRNSGFESFVRDMIPKQIPIAYLESYGALIKKANNGSYPKYPKLTWTSNAFAADEVFKAVIAETTENGSPLIIGQHGGHYGMGRWNSAEEHELAIADRYFSWGWTDTKNSNILPIGIFKSSSLPVRTSRDRQRATLVTCTLQRYSGFMISSFMSTQYLSYLEDQFEFIAHLPETIRHNLTVRLYKHDEGWNQEKRWRERYEEINLDNGHSDFLTLMRESKIFVCSYNATTYLQSLSERVPTIIFWNQKHWELRDSAIPYFEKLKEVGIFHESPASAARHCIAVWDNVEAWWDSEEVESVIKDFCQQYARPQANLLNTVEAVIREVISESKTQTFSA
jgi:putative transferase (TIGR04331 family)